MVRGWPVCYFLLEAGCKEHDNFITILKSLNPPFPQSCATERDVEIEREMY